jgi:prepilin-type N-terminal cleavage/methylation domain-containing protein
MRQRYSTSRGGFSLIEVMLATAILLGSVVVLGELASMGRRQSEKGKKLAEAQQLCEQTLNEVLLGLRPLEPVEQEPLLPAEPILGGETSGREFAELAADLEPFPIAEDTSPLATAAGNDPAESAEWVHSLRVMPLDEHPGLAVLTVVVEQPPETTGRPVRFELSRWIDDPLGGAVEDESNEGPGLERADLGSVIP